MFFISLKNMSTTICSILTLYLIYQVLFTYVVEKPTNTSREQKDLEISDLPEVMVCLDPGLNYTSLMKYGYHSTYSLGVIDKKFAGWNGGAQETKSSNEILEEVLLVPDSWRFNKPRLISSASYLENHIDLEQSEVTPSTGAPKISCFG